MSEQINWEPQNVADLATQLSRIGNEYRSAVAEIYRSFNNIGLESQWVGKNYNAIANQILNASINTFQGWADYLQITIPRTVYEIAEVQAETGGGSVSFSLAPNSTEIQSIQETQEKGDGSQILEPNTVRSVLSGSIATSCEIATAKLQDFYNQFQELGTLNDNAAILEMYNELESILQSNRALLTEFQDQVSETVERSIQNTELTNEETINIANRLSSIINS